MMLNCHKRASSELLALIKEKRVLSLIKHGRNFFSVGTFVPLWYSHLIQFVDSNIWVNGDDLKKVNKTSIPVPGEEDKYWVELSVVHELHCIVSLKCCVNTMPHC